jgi:chorismate mutase
LPYVSSADRIAGPMANAEMQERIRELRERVDEVDRELIRALNERARIVQEIMALKVEAGAPVYDPKREEEILQKVVEMNTGPIYDSSMRDIFEMILHRIRDLEIQRGEFSR